MGIDYEAASLSRRKQIAAREEVAGDGLQMCVPEATPGNEVIFGGNVSHQEVQYTKKNVRFAVRKIAKSRNQELTKYAYFRVYLQRLSVQL